jgi:MoaA/NifB/PqqE/SkfB family radical SAM enzyme
MRLLPLSKYFVIAKCALANYLNHDNIYPFYASFKVTHKCGLRCKFCNVWKENTPDLVTEEVNQVLHQLGQSSIAVVSLEGGDPLMRKDLGEILQYAHSQPFYLFFTTNGHLIDKKPMEEYSKYIDYLHISIDEGHNNLDFFERLAEFSSFGSEICIQIVVTSDTLDVLEEKIRKIYRAGVRTVVMPATHLKGTEDHYPDPLLFQQKILELKKKYKNTITTPRVFLDNITKTHGCSPSSIIIDSDGGLFYPCRTIGTRLYSFTNGPFMDFLKSPEALFARNEMKKCSRSCGWYQYFATDAFSSPLSIISSFSPYIFK